MIKEKIPTLFGFQSTRIYDQYLTLGLLINNHNNKKTKINYSQIPCSMGGWYLNTPKETLKNTPGHPNGVNWT